MDAKQLASWKDLVQQSQTKSLLHGRLKGRIKRYGAMVVDWTGGRLIHAGSLTVAGVLLFAFFAGNMKHGKLIFPGLLLLCFSLKNLLGYSRIYFDVKNNRIRLCWAGARYWFFPLNVDIPVDGLRLAIEVNASGYGGGFACLLLLRHDDYPDYPVCLAGANNTDDLHVLLLSFEQIFGLDADDYTCDSCEVGKNKMLYFSRLPLSFSEFNFRCGGVLKKVSAQKVILSQPMLINLVWWWCLFCGLCTFATVPLMNMYEFGLLLLIGIIGGFFFAIGLGGIFSLFGQRRVIIDRDRGVIQYGWRRKIDFSEVGAVQICSRWKSGRDDCLITQFNLLLRGANDNRILLMDHRVNKSIMDNAGFLAEFLNVPLIDSRAGNDSSSQ